MDDLGNTRRAFATIWLGLVVVGLVARYFRAPNGVILAWLGAVVTMFLTVAAYRPGKTEALVRPRLYRGVALATLAVSLEGVVLGLWPYADSFSQEMAVYFGLVAILAFRAVLARNPRPAIMTVVIALLAWLPLILLQFGCRLHAPPPHWTMHATRQALLVLQLLAGMLAGVSLIAWQWRPSNFAEARAILPRSV